MLWYIKRNNFCQSQAQLFLQRLYIGWIDIAIVTVAHWWAISGE